MGTRLRRLAALLTVGALGGIACAGPRQVPRAPAAPPGPPVSEGPAVPEPWPDPILPADAADEPEPPPPEKIPMRAVPAAELPPPSGTGDPFLESATAAFPPASGAAGLAAVKEAAGGLLARDPRTGEPDASARARAVAALATLETAVALHLPRVLRESQAEAVTAIEGALADARAALVAAGQDPDRVVWKPSDDQYHGTLSALARTLVVGTAEERARARASLGGLPPRATWVLLRKVSDQILLEPAREAIQAAQSAIYRSGDLRRIASWLATRLGRTLRVDRDVFASPRPLEDRRLVDPHLALDWVATEQLCDYLEGDEGIVLWRRVRLGGADGPQEIRAEIALPAGLDVASAYRALAAAGSLRVALGEGVDGAATLPAPVALRELTWEDALRSFARHLHHAVRPDGSGGWTIVKGW
ncbi:MAG: hypothetical protein L0216_18270 [Planctomycetales bacterium]|nr:hypothetical protein [Planctomycetales bacterium]